MPYVSQFSLDFNTGELKLKSSIDREDVNAVNLVVKATADCTGEF